MQFANFRKTVTGICLSLSVLLVACVAGDGQLAGGGIGGTGITSGTITGFGSVFVNGVEFDTAGATRNIDEVITVSNGFDDSSVLGSGMVVTITGTVNPDGITGSATSITYDEALNGPIVTVPVEDADGVHKTFRVLDMPVSVDRNVTVFVNTDYQSLGIHDVVEISGFFDAAGTLVATRLALEGVLGQGTVVEIRGTVSGFDGVDTFSIGSLHVTFDGNTVFEDLPGTVANGQYVEVNGMLQGPATIHATRIEDESDGLGGFSGEASVEGLVTAFVDIGNFLLDGLPVDASNAIYSPLALAGTLGNDQRIEVEGSIAGGVLMASRVEQRSGAVKLAGQVVTVDVAAGTFGVEIVSGQPSITVMLDTRSQLEDELLQVQPFTLADIAAGDPVVMQGYLDSAGSVVAGEVKRRILDSYELAGPVVAAGGDASSGSVTIFGVTMATDNRTEFEDSNDQQFPGGGDGFFGVVQPGDIVELDDEFPADGIADKVELQD
jgi:hypothetical protein